MLMNTAIPITNKLNNNFVWKKLPTLAIITSTKNERTTPITMLMVLDPYRKMYINVYYSIQTLILTFGGNTGGNDDEIITI